MEVRTGSIVLIDFPFTDLGRRKRRPAAVIADASRGDWVLCQVTSNDQADARAVRLDTADFADGGLRVTSFARPLKLFTANERIILRPLARLTPDAQNRLLKGVVSAILGEE